MLSEKDLIKQLTTLKSVKMDEKTKSAMFLSLSQELSLREVPLMAGRRSNLVISGFYPRLLRSFQSLAMTLSVPVPQIALAGFLVMLIAGSLSFAILLSRSNFYGDLPATISRFKHKENEETRFVNKEKEENNQISPFYPARPASESKRIYTSLQSEEELLGAFRADLMERINRAWVLALESGNDEAFAVAQEAEKFYQEGDYDAALRAVIVAESMLQD